MMGGEPDYLGRGWEFPPTFGKEGGDVAMVEGSDDIAQSLSIILGTERSERLMRPDFGVSMRQFQFETIDRKLTTQMSAAIRDAIIYHEPRIRLDTVDVSQDPGQPGLLLISIAYCVRSSNSRYNLILHHTLGETTGGEPR